MEELVGTECSVGPEDSASIRDPVDMAAAADTPRNVQLLLASVVAALLQKLTALLARLGVTLASGLGGGPLSYLHRFSFLCSVNGSIMSLFELSNFFLTMYSSPKIISMSSLVETKKSTGSWSFVPSGYSFQRRLMVPAASILCPLKSYKSGDVKLLLM